jgi:transcriptional regulator GlxA family with amidase domain
LDLTGPVEVFDVANRHRITPQYRVEVVGPTGAPIVTTSGITIIPARGIGDGRSAVDTFIVAGGQGVEAVAGDAALVDSVRKVARRSRRVASVCTGSFLLAEAGLLDGRRVTTHWASCRRLARRYPDLDVDPDPIFVRDGNVFTSAGVTAGMDLALALVEDDLGRDVALAIARRLVLFLRRPANQSQFSAPLRSQAAERDGIRVAQHLVAEHPEGDCSVAALARAALMSERNFARCFTAEVGVTPARYVERVRVETARRLLEDTDDGVEAVATAAGFGTGETMRRTFLRRLRTNPTEYRRRFRAA